MRISDWSSDVCSSDLSARRSKLIFADGNEKALWSDGPSTVAAPAERNSQDSGFEKSAVGRVTAAMRARSAEASVPAAASMAGATAAVSGRATKARITRERNTVFARGSTVARSLGRTAAFDVRQSAGAARSAEHTPELQSLMRISYAVYRVTK